MTMMSLGLAFLSMLHTVVLGPKCP